MRNQRLTFILLIAASMMLMASVTTAEIVSARDNTPAAICSDIDTRFLTDLTCYDDYCAELEANCTEVEDPATYDLQKVSDVWDPLPSISDDGTTVVTCQDGWAVSGYYLTGETGVDRGDNVFLGCKEAVQLSTGDPVYHTNCEWSNWISEEPGFWDHNWYDIPANGYTHDNWNNPANSVACSAGKVVTGMECSTLNGWCDNMRIQCCELKPAPVAPVTCDPADATALPYTDSGTTQWFTADKCLKINPYTPWWFDTIRDIQLQNPEGSVTYPLDYTWKNDCGESGTGTITGVWDDQLLEDVDPSCVTTIKLNGAGSEWIGLRYWVTN